jgi:hypothetical protein
MVGGCRLKDLHQDELDAHRDADPAESMSATGW